MKIKRLTTRILMILLALAVIALPNRAVSARRWMVADQRNYVIARVCTDGVVVVMVHGQSANDEKFFPSDKDQPAWVNMGVRKITANNAPLPDYDGNLIIPPASYGPVLAPLQQRWMSHHSVPLPVDIYGNVGIDVYYIYAFHKITWSVGQVQAGDLVLVVGQSWSSPDAYTGQVASAENCRVNQFSYPRSGPVNIDSGHFPVVSPHLDPSLPVYTAYKPLFGTIFVNGGLPTYPFQFSQQDISSGLVTYSPAPPSAPVEGDLVTVRAVSTAQSSINSDSAAGDNESSSPSISRNGRYVTFTSLSSNLPGGDGIISQIYLHDRDADGNGIYDEPGGVSTVLVSTGSSGKGNNDSWTSSVSGDGKSVAFYSLANNLAAGDTNDAYDIFVRTNNVTTRVSVASDGTQADANSFDPAISGNGRFIVFYSYASNLVPGIAASPTAFSRIYLHDRDTDGNGVFDEQGKTSTVLISKDYHGAPINADSYGASISSNGRYVVFDTLADNVVSGDTNGKSDVFLYDTTIQKIEIISLTADGLLSTGDSYSDSGPIISDDGRFVVFYSDAKDMVSAANDSNTYLDVFVRDRNTLQTRLVTYNNFHDGPGGGDSTWPSISGNGRFIVYDSSAADLVANDTAACQISGVADNCTDVFAFDQESGETVMLSVNGNIVNGNFDQSNGYSDTPVISGDGSFAAFASSGANLIPGVSDNNGAPDVFTAYVGFPFSQPILGEDRVYLPAVGR